MKHKQYEKERRESKRKKKDNEKKEKENKKEKCLKKEVKWTDSNDKRKYSKRKTEREMTE